MSVDLSISNRIATLTLNNPSRLNVISSVLMKEVHEKLQDIDQKANVLVITGCKKAFAAGVDVSEIKDHSCESAILENFIDYRWESIFSVKIPVIAAVSGYALGGGFELALMCDIIIATENAKFGFPEINLGIMPGMGGTQLLTRIVGPKLAAEFIMTGDFISAQKAKDLNIVSRITADNELMEKAIELAQKISQKSVTGLRMIKDAIRLAQNEGINQGIQEERRMFRSLFSTKDKKEKIEQFLNKKN